MRLENSFDVPATPEVAWLVLNDVPRVLPCMPGAELDEIVDENTFKVTLHVKVGAVSMRMKSEVRRTEVDEAAHTVVLVADAKDEKGRGGAVATITSSLAPAEGGARATVVTDVQLRGTLASIGRGVVGAVAGELTKTFAARLSEQLEDGGGAPPPAAGPCSRSAASASCCARCSRASGAGRSSMAPLSELFGLAGRVAIVTGASGGLGLEMARALAEAGAKLVVCSRDAERCAEVARELGGGAIGLRCDVRSEEEVDAVVRTRWRSSGGSMCSSTTPGRHGRPSPEDTRPEDWNRVMDINLTGTFLMARRVGRELIAAGRGGRIVNVSSMAGLVGTPSRIIDAVAYSTSKGASSPSRAIWRSSGRRTASP